MFRLIDSYTIRPSTADFCRESKFYSALPSRPTSNVARAFGASVTPKPLLFVRRQARPTMVHRRTTAPNPDKVVAHNLGDALAAVRPARTKDDRDEEPRLQHQLPRPDRKAR